MATSLASQLAGLAQANQQATKKIRGKPSLLFDYAKAADLDLATIHHIGCEGLDELCRLDPRFAGYRQSLFSQAATTFVRDQQTPDVVAKMDETLEAFLAQLSNHFMSAGAFKALEYLIRRYRVNEYNIPSLLLAALPYHATNEFVRLVQTMTLGNAQGWAWLARMQGSGAALPRDVYVRRCINDRAMLRFLCDGAKSLGGKKASSHTYLSFYAVALCEVIAEAKVDEGMVEVLLPYLVEGLAAGAATDYRAATCMALAELCSRATLSHTFLSAIAVSIVRGMEHTPEHVRTVLLVLAHAAATQRHLTELPSSALKGLLSIDGLTSELSSLAASGCRIQPLIRLLASSLATRLLSATDDDVAGAAASPLLALVGEGLLEVHAKALCTTLLSGACNLAAAAPPSTGKRASKKAAAAAVPARARAQSVLRALELHHPSSVDAAIDAALARPGDDDGGRSGSAGAGHPPARDAVYDFVAETFAGTPHALVTGAADDGAACRSTLLAAAVAPQAGMRVVALEHADTLLASGQLPDESASQLHGIAVAALADQEWPVVRAALSMQSLLTAPAFALLPALATLLQRLSAVLLAPSKPSDAADANGAAKAALSALATLAAREVGGSECAAPGAVDAALLALMDFTLAPPHALPAAKAAVRAARTLSAAAAGDMHTAQPSAQLAAVLAPALGAWEEPPDVRSPTKGAADKKEKKALRASASASLRACAVGALAGALRSAAAEQQGVEDAVLLLARAAADDGGHLHARHLLLLGLHAAVATAGTAKPGRGRSASVAAAGGGFGAAAAARLLARLCRAELRALASWPGGAPPLSGWSDWAGAALDSASAAPTAEHVARMATEPAHSHAALTLHALHTALAAVAAGAGAGAGAASAAPAAAAGDAELHEQFAAVAALSPPGAFDGHLQLLLDGALPSRAARQAFLAQTYAVAAVPGAGIGAHAACAALRLQASSAAIAGHLAASPHATPSKAPKPASGAEPVALEGVLPYLLAAAGSLHHDVRAAACACMAQLAASGAGAGSGPASPTLSALSARSALIEADAHAASALLGRTLAAQRAAPAAAPPQGKKAKKKAAGLGSGGAAHAPPGAECLSELDGDTVAALSPMLVSAIDTLERAGAAELAAATAVLTALGAQADADVAEGVVDPGAQRAAARLLARVMDEAVALTPPSAASLPAPGAQAALQMLSPVMAAALTLPPSESSAALADGDKSVGGDGDGAASVVRDACARLLASAPAAPCMLPARAALLRSMARSPGAAFDAMAAGEQRPRVFVALVESAAGDTHSGARAAARAVLEAAAIDDGVIVPLLRVAAPAAAAATAAPPARKRSKKAAAQPADVVQGSGTLAAAPDADALRRAVMVLELLQWKAGVRGAAAVVEATQALLAGLLPMVGSIAVPSDELAVADADAEGGDDVGAQGAAAAGAAAAGDLSSLCGYATQLALSAVERMVRSVCGAGRSGDDGMDVGGGGGGGSDAEGGAEGGTAAGAAMLSVLRPSLAVDAAQSAPDAALRNAALSLMSLLAGVMPSAVLEHVLQVLSVINASAAIQDDAHSQAVSKTAMSALVPAWLAHGREPDTLWKHVVSALPSVLPHRRLNLLLALMEAAGPDAGLPVALLLLMTHAADAPADAPPSAGGGGGGGDGEAAVPEAVWLQDLAARLAQQVEPPARIAALASLLRRAVAASAGTATGPVPRLAVAFAEGQLRAHGMAAAALPVAEPDAAPHDALQAGCSALMSAALEQVTALAVSATPGTSAAGTPRKAGKRSGGAEPGRASARATKAALEGVYGLLAALQGVMHSDAYLHALHALMGTPGDKLQRRVLRLFATKVRALRAELESLADLPSQRRAEHQERLASAALLPIAALPHALSASPPCSAMLKQAHLDAAAAAATAFGRLRPEAIVASVPALVACGSDASPAVRGSAFVALSAVAGAVGVRLVPHLPAAMAALLASGQAALPRLDAADRGAAAAGARMDGDGLREAGTGTAAGTAEPRVSLPEGASPSAEEEPAFELAAALAALSAFADALGAFLSPYLQDVLALLLARPLLGCRTAGVDAAAASVRDWLPGVIPARLLLDPLFAQLPACTASGPEPTTALLAMVASLTQRLDTQAASAYSEQIFLFLLRVLDVRAIAPRALTGHVQSVESAAVAALVALVMKLTETKFKPMFLRLVEWAAAADGGGDDDDPVGGGGGGDGGGAGVARQVALYAVASALTARLRSVFVPYFRYLLDAAVAHLAGGAAAGGPKKKKRRASVGTGAGMSEGAWLLRVRVVHALHRAMLHDGGGFFTADRLDKLLQPLVDQLEAAPPGAVLPALAAQCADAELDGYVASGRSAAGADMAAYDAAGVAAVAALVQMGVTANTDVFWKPLNHRVLMVTRAASTRARLLALEVVVQLVERLREEYLPLLPETIPFVAELLEDTDGAVEARAQQLVALLEEVSGEKLDQYLKI